MNVARTESSLILETVVSTRGPGGDHLAPMGIRRPDAACVQIAPFIPSRTLENLRATGVAVVNMSDDVRVFAGCLCGRGDWPLVPAAVVAAPRLDGALAHLEVEVQSVIEDPQRPRFDCRVVHEATHAPFRGFNRAQAAVIEAAILVSRLDRLAPERIAREIAYLQIAIDKTAGARERQAWQWLRERLEAAGVRGDAA